MPDVEESSLSRLRGALSCTWAVRGWMWVAQWDVMGVETSLVSRLSLPGRHILFYINPMLRRTADAEPIINKERESAGGSGKG